jgi:hypothetical protein
MTKQQHIELLMLLSALETWCIASTTQRLPEGLATQLDMSIAAVTKEVLK